MIGMRALRTLLGGLFLFGGTLQAGIDGDPLYERRVGEDDSRFLAVRPFYSHSEDPAKERWRNDYLWPLYTRKGFKEETYSRFLFFGFSTDFSEEDERDRTWVIPFYFQGTSADGENYFALFPIGGTIHEFLGRDKLMFALFPIYGQSQINDVKTKSVLWPIYSRSKGEDVDRFRVWPLYGYSESKDEFRKKFILWPIYNAVEYTNDRNPGGGHILFPFYGRIMTERASNYWLLPPFFRWTNSEEQRIWSMPWPFIQIADGEMYKRVFWPLYGKKELGTLSKQYVLWPFIWNNRTRYALHDQHRRWVVPLFSYRSHVVTRATGGYDVGDVSARYWKLWPLMSWERNGEESRFRTLELWPLRNTPGIERNWAPWWTLYHRDADADERSHHFLWGLYRQRRGEDRFEWSLLKGLAGYKKEGEHRQYRFLFMGFGDREEQP